MLSNKLMRTKLYPLTQDFFDDWTETHRRWSCYHHHGIQCCVPGCNRKGTHVVHWYSPQDYKKYGDSGRGEHIDLIGYDENGQEFLMTVDHIIPQSKGGPKVWQNLRPMCETHNHNQGNKVTHQPTRAQLEVVRTLTDINRDFNIDTLTDVELLDCLVQFFLKRMEPKKKK